LIEHRILAARRNHHVFRTVAVQIAERSPNVGQERELGAKLLLHKVVVDLARCGRRLRESWKQGRKTERQE